MSVATRIFRPAVLASTPSWMHINVVHETPHGAHLVTKIFQGGVRWALSVQITATHVVQHCVREIALDHHGSRLEQGHGNLGLRQLSLVGLLRRDDRRTAAEQEVNARVEHQSLRPLWGPRFTVPSKSRDAIN